MFTYIFSISDRQCIKSTIGDFETMFIKLCYQGRKEVVSKLLILLLKSLNK